MIAMRIIFAIGWLMLLTGSSTAFAAETGLRVLAQRSLVDEPGKVPMARSTGGSRKNARRNLVTGPQGAADASPERKLAHSAFSLRAGHTFSVSSSATWMPRGFQCVSVA